MLGVQETILGIKVDGGRESSVSEANMVIACGNQSLHGPHNIDELSDFCIDTIISEFQSYASSLYAFFPASWPHES